MKLELAALTFAVATSFGSTDEDIRVSRHALVDATANRDVIDD